MASAAAAVASIYPDVYSAAAKGLLRLKFNFLDLFPGEPSDQLGLEQITLVQHSDKCFGEEVLFG